MGFRARRRRAGQAAGGRLRVQAPGSADREARAADGGRRLPLPAAAAGLGGMTAGVSRAAGPARRRDSPRAARAGPLRRGHAHREPGRRHVSGRSRCCGRCRSSRPRTRASRGGCWPATRSPLTWSATTRRAGRAGSASCWPICGPARDLALVTDAGTPLVSDPGGELASAWAAEGGIVVPIPGASAVLAALVASGLAAARWTFEGFLPRGGRERRERLARIAADERACVIYEAPSRVAGDPRRSRRRGGPGPARGRLPRADEAPRGSRARTAGRAGGAGRRRRDHFAGRVRHRRGGCHSRRIGGSGASGRPDDGRGSSGGGSPRRFWRQALGRRPPGRCLNRPGPARAIPDGLTQPFERAHTSMLSVAFHVVPRIVR